MKMIQIALNTLAVTIFSLVLSTQTALAAETADSAQPTTITQAQVETVDINTAGAQALAETLNGVGPKKAQAIIEFREAYGQFAAPKEITAVKGIGEATYQKNADHIITN